MTRPRQAVLTVIIALALLAGAASAASFWLTNRMLAGWNEWRADARAQGVQIQSGPPSRIVSPFAAAITLPAITVDAGLATWQAARVQLTLSIFHPGTLTIAVDGEQSLRLEGWPPIAITARRLTAAVALADPQHLQFEGLDLTATRDGSRLAVARLAGSLDEGALTIALSQITLPLSDLPFGGVIDHAAAHIRATGALLRAQQGAGLPDPAQAARAWAQAGGAVIADQAAVRWGPLDVTGHFTAALDAALQPTADGMLHTTGYHEVIGALVRAGTIGRNAARVATTVLDLMATAAAPDVVDVPVTLQNGALSMGAIPLLRIAPMNWP